MKKITLFFTVLMLLASSLAYGQTLTVKGVVSDAGNGEPVPFASIQVKGTMVGAMTDADGNYSIKVDKDAVLIFSFLGYSDSEVPVKGQAVINVSMFPDNNVLDEVVVTGMMVTDKRLFTGSVAKVNAADSKIDGMADISRSLEGRAAGVSVQNVSGTFGTAPKIRVRGATSIYGSSKQIGRAHV